METFDLTASSLSEDGNLSRRRSTTRARHGNYTRRDPGRDPVLLC